jgi:hypothetical protein
MFESWLLLDNTYLTKLYTYSIVKQNTNLHDLGGPTNTD